MSAEVYRGEPDAATHRLTWRHPYWFSSKEGLRGKIEIAAAGEFPGLGANNTVLIVFYPEKSEPQLNQERLSALSVEEILWLIEPYQLHHPDLNFIVSVTA